VIEPRVGGRAYEDWGDGAGLLWFTVLGFDPQKSLLLQGHLTPAYGGPVTTLVQINLKESGEGTLLQICDTTYGRIGDALPTRLRAGWTAIFDAGLKAFVEAGPRA